MVRLTRAVVLQGISKVSIDKRDTIDIDKEFGRVTHLHLQRKDITTLDSLHLFQSLTVLYLYENQISKIEGLEQAFNLEILHLQRNRVKRIENLLNCKKLRKLYLGYNEIETVEGLHTLEKLEELHVEHQRLENGMSLTFDPKSLNTLCNCLMILNISGNNIDHIEDLAGMEELHTLLASQNDIEDLDSTSLVVRTLGNLRVLDLQDNSIARRPQFKERIIGFGGNIQILNDKEIPDATRDFIQRFVSVKAARLKEAVKRSSSSSVHPRCPAEAEAPTRPSYYDYEYIPSNSPYASSASLERDSPLLLDSTSSPSRMSPTKSNLTLNLPGQVYPCQFPRRLTPQPTRRSLSQMTNYLSRTTTEVPSEGGGSRQSNSTPQFILAPPSFHHHYHHDHNNSSEAGGGDDSTQKLNFSIRSSMKKRNSAATVATPSFKRSTSKDDDADHDLFKSPKVNADEIWSSSSSSHLKTRNGPKVNSTSSKANTNVQRAVVKLIKSPVPIQRCSRQAFVEGMPMPSTSLLRMAPSQDLNFIYTSRGGSKPVRLAKTSAYDVSNGFSALSSQNNKLLTDDEVAVAVAAADQPGFTTSIYEFPPWPHIFNRWTADQPAVTFMP